MPARRWKRPEQGNLQPWYFVAISDPVIRHQIRIQAEKVEREFYERAKNLSCFWSWDTFGPNARVPDIQRKDVDLIRCFVRSDNYDS
jgi:nitroreductase